MTWLGSMAPEAHALPAETAIPSRSRRSSSCSEVDAAETQIRDVRCARRAAAVHAHAGNAAQSRGFEFIAQHVDAGRRFGSLARSQFERLGQAHDARHVLRSGTLCELLAASADERR